jgi:hypothetical protein
MNISTAKKLATILRDTLAALRSAQVSALLLTLMALSPLSAMAQNPVPLVYQPTVPTAAAPGGSTFTLTVAGVGFVSGSVINWNGSAQTTTYVSGEKLTASIPASDLATASTATITVTSPAPGGGTSNPVYFTVNKSYPAVSLVRNDISAGAPSGIAVGNLSGNGILDLVVANNPTTDGAGNDVAVYLGIGDGMFQAPVTYPVGHPGAVVLADFNGDGKLDIAVLQPVAGKVAILLGNGDGTFGSEVGYNTGQNPMALAAADVNGDGSLDLVVANYNSNTVSVLLGNGNGTFQTHQDYSTGVKPVSVAVADFNGDGKPDLAVANNNDNTVSILLNNGSGAFPTQATYATAAAPTGLVAADFGNGNMDLALSSASQNLSVLLGNGDGTFQAQVEYPTGVNSQAIATADMNSDGFLDLIVANYTDGTLSILMGNGTGAFKAQSVYPTNLGPSFMSIGDFTNTGKLDVAVVDVTADMVSIMTQSAISISPTLAKFAIEELNTTSPAMQITLKNGSALPYGLSSVTIGGTNATDFALGTNTCGTSVPASGTCSISVTFDPQPIGTYWWLQPQDRSAELLLNGSSGSSTGAGLAGDGQVGITLGPVRHAIFKTQLIYTSSAPNTSTFTNDSGVPITFTGQYYNEPSGIVIYGTNANDFSLSTTCPVAAGSTLAAGASCTASVTYTPSIVGNETATLAFFGTFSPGNGQQAVEFTASSTAVSVAPLTVSFPTTTVGTTSAAKATVFKNAGSTALPITLSLQGADAKDFAISKSATTCGATVAAGASCKIAVTFNPLTTGALTATLNIGDSDPTGPQMVTLTGTGQ